LREYEIKLWEVKVSHTLGGVPLEWGNGMPEVRGEEEEQTIQPEFVYYETMKRKLI
jgi:hypothetical protein